MRAYIDSVFLLYEDGSVLASTLILVPHSFRLSPLTYCLLPLACIFH